MEKSMYVIRFRNEVGDWESIDREFPTLRNATFEARDLQRILSKDRKDSTCYYAVFYDEKLIYSAYGY